MKNCWRHLKTTTTTAGICNNGLLSFSLHHFICATTQPIPYAQSVFLTEQLWHPANGQRNAGCSLHLFIYPPTPADARGSAPGNNTFETCSCDPPQQQQSKKSADPGRRQGGARQGRRPEERVREERLWTTRNTTTGLGKLSKGAAAEQQQWQ